MGSLAQFRVRINEIKPKIKIDVEKKKCRNRKTNEKNEIRKDVLC